jgi:hypothetical protein
MARLIAQAVDFNQIGDTFAKETGIKRVFLPGPANQIGEIISLVLPYVFIIAGLLLLFFLITGGFQLMFSANNEKGIEAAKGKVTNALLGFLLLFVSYWIVQILEIILGIDIFK